MPHLFLNVVISMKPAIIAILILTPLNSIYFRRQEDGNIEPFDIQ
jgi:hypothetical protein